MTYIIKNGRERIGKCLHWGKGFSLMPNKTQKAHKKFD